MIDAGEEVKKKLRRREKEEGSRMLLTFVLELLSICICHYTPTRLVFVCLT